MRRKILLWLGGVFSLVFLYAALRGIEFSQFVDALRGVEPLPVIAAFFVMLLVYVTRTLRWKAIIESTARISHWDTFSALMIGFFANNVLPARAGELLRAVILKRQIGVTKSYALGTIIVERMMDLVALVGLLLVAVYRLPSTRLPAATSEVRAIAFGILAVVILGMVVLLWARERVVRELTRLLSRLMSDRRAGILAGKVEQLSVGLEVLRNPGRMIYVAVLSVLSWLGMVVIFALVFAAFRLDLPPAAAGFSVSLVNLGMAVPSSPGFVGTYEFFMVASLGAFSVGSATALAFGLVTRLLWYVFEVVVGFGCLWKSQLRLGELARGASDDPEPASNTA